MLQETAVATGEGYGSRITYHNGTNPVRLDWEAADSYVSGDAAYRLRMIAWDRQQWIGHSSKGRALGPSPQHVRFGTSVRRPESVSSDSIRWRQDGRLSHGKLRYFIDSETEGRHAAGSETKRVNSIGIPYSA